MKKKKLLNIYLLLSVAFILVLVVMPRKITAMPEIETKLLLTAIGIDREGEEYTLSATDVMPAESQDGTLKKLSVSASGKSVSDCFNALSIKTGKKLELGLCGLVLLGNSFETQCVLPDLKYLLSSGKIIPGAYLAYCPSSNAKEILEKANKLSSASSNGLATLLEHSELGNSVALTTLLEFLSDSASVTESAYMPCIEIADKKGSKGEGENDKEEKKETEIKNLGEIALFKNGTMVEKLSEDEVKGLCWLDKNSVRGHVSLEKFTFDGEDRGSLYATLMDKSVSISAKKSNLWKVKIKITATLNLEDRHILTIINEKNASEERISKEVREQFKQKVISDIERYVAVTKEYDCDAMGITEVIYRKNAKKYRKNAQASSVYQNTEIEYAIKIKIN